MAKSIVTVGVPGGATIVIGTTYLPPVGNIITSSVGEAPKSYAVRSSGTFSNFFSYVSSNTLSNTGTFTLRKSLADTSITVSYTSGETGIKEDTSNTASFSATDELDYSFVVASGGTSIVCRLLSVQFEPDNTSDCVQIVGIAAANPLSGASTSYYECINGSIATTANTEADVTYRARLAFTASNLYTYIHANSRTTDIICKTRKNAADGSQSVTYTSGQTGSKEDTSNTDSVSIGDDFCYVIVNSTGTETNTWTATSVQVKNTSGQFPLENGRSSASTSINFNTTVYLPASGNHVATTTTEAYTQVYPRFDFTAKELIANVTANTIATSATTIKLRDNGADSSLVLSYAAAETGLKNDTSNTATITSGSDEINYAIATPNTSGAFAFRWMGILGETAAASTFTPKVMMM